MPFQGSDPYGTPGGVDTFNKPQTPEDNRISYGRTAIAIIRVNGPVTQKLRTTVEDIVRTISAAGGALVAVIVRDDGSVVDNAVNDLDFTSGVAIQQVAGGSVVVFVPNAGITQAMLVDSIINAAKLATDAVTTAKIQNGAVTLAKLAGNSVDSSKIVDGSILPADLSQAYKLESFAPALVASNDGLDFMSLGANTLHTLKTLNIVVPNDTDYDVLVEWFGHIQGASAGSSPTAYINEGASGIYAQTWHLNSLSQMSYQGSFNRLNKRNVTLTYSFYIQTGSAGLNHWKSDFNIQAIPRG